MKKFLNMALTDLSDKLQSELGSLTFTKDFLLYVQKRLHVQKAARDSADQKIDILGKRIRQTQEMQNDLIAEKGHHEKLLHELRSTNHFLASAILFLLQPPNNLSKADQFVRKKLQKELEKMANYYTPNERDDNE